ncbi:MAG: glyoxalase/bleomycin resistance/dioxygenase family protein [Actinomycetota bacterium]|nr:glyoxalase/bleomycin resistance/dioxygenase family protein [Actinomycetota bacterium]
MHRILLNTFVIDTPSATQDQTVEFWATALAAEAQATPMPQYHVLGDAMPPNRVVVQGVRSGHAGVHFDIHTDDLDAEVARLERAGAEVVRSWADHPGCWVVMKDPAGMEFCVVWALNERRPQEDRDDFERRARPVE